MNYGLLLTKVLERFIEVTFKSNETAPNRQSEPAPIHHCIHK